MNTPNIETDTTAQAVAPAEEPKSTKKATSGARKPRVAASKPKSGKKATPAKKAPKGATAAKTALLRGEGLAEDKPREQIF